MHSVLERVSRNSEGETDFAMRWAYRGLFAAMAGFVLWLEWRDRDSWIGASGTIALYAAGIWAGLMVWGFLIRALGRWIGGDRAAAKAEEKPKLGDVALNQLVLLVWCGGAASGVVLRHELWPLKLGAGALGVVSLLAIGEMIGRRLGLIKPEPAAPPRPAPMNLSGR